MFNVILFYVLFFGVDFVEEYFLYVLFYVDIKVFEIKDKVRKLNMDFVRSNFFKYYILSLSEVCKGKNIFLFFFIFSSLGNGIRRDFIRRIWGNVISVGGYFIFIFFVLGMFVLVII